MLIIRRSRRAHESDKQQQPSSSFGNLPLLCTCDASRVISKSLATTAWELQSLHGTKLCLHTQCVGYGIPHWAKTRERGRRACRQWTKTMCHNGYLPSGLLVMVVTALPSMGSCSGPSTAKATLKRCSDPEGVNHQ